VKEVALRNGPATARKYYVHPAILDAYAEGKLDHDPIPHPDQILPELFSVEYRLIALLRREFKPIKPCEPASAPQATSPGFPESPAIAATWHNDFE
jgi:hypothetical protein